MATLYQQFLSACERGDLETAKTLVSHVNIHAYDESAFRWTCRNGQLEVAKWLLTQGIDIHADNEVAFRYACYNGHLEVAKWLLTQGVHIHADDEGAFRYACYNGYLEVAKWLVRIGVVPASDHKLRGYYLRCAFKTVVREYMILIKLQRAWREWMYTPGRCGAKSAECSFISLLKS